VPLHLLERIVLRSNVRVESSALARLADSGIALAAFGGRIGDKLAMVHGHCHNDGARRIGQYRRYDDPDWQRRWAHRLVLAKLNRQRRLLARGLAERADLRHPLTTALAALDGAIARILADPFLGVVSLRGIEGAAAAAYFKGFCALFPASLDFTGRNRRPPRDPVNAVLSLGYTLLHAEAVRAAYGAGLDPIIGYYHRLDFGRDSLASDCSLTTSPIQNGSSEYTGLSRAWVFRSSTPSFSFPAPSGCSTPCWPSSAASSLRPKTTSVSIPCPCG
jgi:CRISPR-associated protein Cas1